MRLVAALVVLLATVSTAHAERDLGARARAVLSRSCARCHGGGPGRAKGDLGFILDADRLIAEGLLTPGLPETSLIVRRIRGAEMPPRGASPRPTPAEIAVLEAWIRGLGGGVAVDPARAIEADLAAVPEEDRPHMRYLTLSHMPGARLPLYRAAVSKLANSLSRARRITRPVAVDAAGTILRIDLRAYVWTGFDWDRLVAVYPYAAPGARPIALRADWFAATASRPPLYGRLLGHVGDEASLQRALRVSDGWADVARAGFVGSGIARQNRIIERRKASDGAYWVSHDFNTSLGDGNIFAHPLDFKRAGGEIIYNLANGLQGYALIDARGSPIERAPTDIVSDPNSPDHVVEVGLSCMGCHDHGILPKSDQVRAAVEANRAAFSDHDVATVKNYYPPADVFAELQAADVARFDKALEEAGVPLSGEEPIRALAAAYDADLDLARAAAEIGLGPAQLRAALEARPDLLVELGPLVTDGGRIKREVWSARFATLGSSVNGRLFPTGWTQLGPGTSVWRDDKTGLVWADPIDQPTKQRWAESACRSFRAAGAARFDLPSAEELVAALADHLGGVLGPAPRRLWSSANVRDVRDAVHGQGFDSSTGKAFFAPAEEPGDYICVGRPPRAP